MRCFAWREERYQYINILSIASGRAAKDHHGQGRVSRVACRVVQTKNKIVYRITYIVRTVPVVVPRSTLRKYSYLATGTCTVREFVTVT